MKRNTYRMTNTTALVILLMLSLNAPPLAAQTPPKTRTENVAETIQGVEVADPYRWLENGASEEVRAWTEAQNAYTRSVLERVPGRDVIRRELERVLRTGAVDAPEVRGRRFFYTRRDPSQNQPVLYVRDSLAGRDRPLVNPNTLDAEGTTALDWWYPANDGKLLAYGLSSSGDEISTLHVLDVDTGRDLADRITRTRAASVAWLPDNSGFYYTRYPAPGSVPKAEETYHRRVFQHRLGDDPEKDAEVFSPKEMTEWADVQLSRDGRWLVVSVSIGFDRNDLFLRDLHKPGGKFQTVVEGRAATYDAYVARTGEMFIRTTEGAPRGRLFVAQAANPQRAAWRELIPQGQSTLNSFTIVGARLFAEYLENASSRIEVYTRGGQRLRAVALPVLGTTAGVRGDEEGGDAFFQFVSFAVPPTIYRYDFVTGKATVWTRVAAPTINPQAFVVRQVWYQSKDGTRVSMFLVHRRGLQLDGTNPTVLYGYGGFNVSETPSFNPRGLSLWLSRGGVYAVANLRGGGEYGEQWHQAGMLARKQNVFDDFIAAAEYLVSSRVTSRERLAIRGGSNGGLLVAAVLTQRPELFRAAVCEVPLTDMLRYQNFLIARLWIPEYGSAEDPAQFKYLRAYSPYHNVRDGTRYPATLVTTAESDTRVEPLHARKFAARLQAANASGNPVLLRIETKAGHGIGLPVTKQIEEATDMWAFLFWQLGVKA
ncbi:MAG TPA: prolyl oligopeptidase family serine peptidase [Pyrinomonadaceae bacterium]|nr:prolyl oligopeptidase family serine peptidase [Pyrinomonadaceae bacterium]